MAKIKYPEIINSVSKPLQVKDAIFQMKYLIERDDLEAAYNIVQIYNLSIEDILSFNILGKDNSFLKFLNSRL